MRCFIIGLKSYRLVSAEAWLPTSSPSHRRSSGVPRRHHLVPWETFRLDSYVGYPAQRSLRTNFPWLGQWVVERESRIWMKHNFSFDLYLFETYSSKVLLLLNSSSVKNLTPISNQFRASSSVNQVLQFGEESRGFQFSHFQRWDFGGGNGTARLETSSVGSFGRYRNKRGMFGHVRCDPAVGQTPNEWRSKSVALYTWTSQSGGAVEPERIWKLKTKVEGTDPAQIFFGRAPPLFGSKSTISRLVSAFASLRVRHSHWGQKVGHA